MPASHGGGYVLFSNSGMGDHGWVASNGLYAAHLTDLNSFGQPDGEGGVHPHMQQVFAPPAVDSQHPWICHSALPPSPYPRVCTL